MKIGFKLKYARNTEEVLPNKSELQKRLDFFEFGLRLNENYREYQKLIKDTDLEVTLHAPISSEGVNLANAQKNDFNRKNIKFCKQAADFFNAKTIVTHPGFKTNEEATLENLCVNLKDYTDKRFVVENVPALNPDIPYERFGTNAEKLLEIQKRTNKNICLDFGHALLQSQIEKRNYYEFIQEIIEKLSPKYYHLSGSDGKGDRHWHVTHPKNIIDYKKILPLLPQDSWLALEIYVFGTKDGFNEGRLFEDIEYLQDLI